MGGDISSWGGGKRLAKALVPILIALSVLDPDFAGFEVHLPDLHVAEF